MLICHDLKLVFVHIPRTGGRSVIEAIRGVGGDSVIGHRHDFPIEVPPYPAFAFVRNPWDRIASLLAGFNRGLDTLRCESLEPMFRPQTTWLRYVAYVGRYENLQADFEWITGLSAALPHIGRSPDRFPLTDEGRALIAEVYAEEIKMLGYSA